MIFRRDARVAKLSRYNVIQATHKSKDLQSRAYFAMTQNVSEGNIDPLTLVWIVT